MIGYTIQSYVLEYIMYGYNLNIAATLTTSSVVYIYSDTFKNLLMSAVAVSDWPNFTNSNITATMFKMSRIISPAAMCITSSLAIF